MEVSLKDGNLQVKEETLKQISYFEALMRFPSSKNLGDIEFEVDCTKSSFQALVHFVQGNNIQLKPEDVSELYALGSYFSYLELPRAIASQCYSYCFLTRDYPSLVPWLQELLSHPDFEEIRNSFSDVHQCLLINAPPGFRVRSLRPIDIPEKITIYNRSDFRFNSGNPSPTLPQYYNLYANQSKARFFSYYSRASIACSDIREAIQYYNCQHGNSQSRTSFQKSISCRFIFDIPLDQDRLWLSLHELSISRIVQRNPNIGVTWHSGNSWDFHLSGGNSGEYALTVTGTPQDILMFLRNDTYNYTQVSLRLHMGYFNRVFQCFPSCGYDAQKNCIFLIRSVQEIRNVLQNLISDESSIVKNPCSRIVFLSYYPQPELLPI